MAKYESQIIAIGELTQEFIDGGILVFFGPDAPDELAEIAIMHSHGTLEAAVQAGDQLVIGDQIWPIVSVGEIANDNLRALGHFVIKFNGAPTPELPGDISVPESAPPEIALGMRIQFRAGAHS